MSEEQTFQEKKERVAQQFLIWSQKSHKDTATIPCWSRQSQASSDLRGGDVEPASQW